MNIEISNYYEHLLIEEMIALVSEGELPDEEDLLNDIACLAMNNLPSRYTHHSVDMAFYLTEKERSIMNQQIAVALNNAIDKVMS